MQYLLKISWRRGIEVNSRNIPFDTCCKFSSSRQTNEPDGVIGTQSCRKTKVWKIALPIVVESLKMALDFIHVIKNPVFKNKN